MTTSTTVGSQTPIIAGQWGLGHVVPSLAAANAATYSQVGNIITVTSTAHGIPVIYHDGKKVYLVKNTGSLETGWFTGLKILNSNTFQCVSTISQTISGNLTTNTAVEIIVPLVVIVPAHSMGANGQLVMNEECSYVNSANAKTRTVRANNVTLYSNARTVTSRDSMTSRLRNKGSEVRQQVTQLSESIGGGTISGTDFNINTGDDFTVNYGITLAAASEFMSLDYFQAVIYPSV